MTLLESPTATEASGDEAAVAAVEMKMRMRRSRQWEMKERRKEKVYPPPIPLLARTENLHSHMPWVLQRTYTSDGRLILREEPVRHHEYFRAHRRDGRLTLQLVPLDNEVDDFEDVKSESESESEPEPENASSTISHNHNDNGDDYLRCPEAEIENWKDGSNSKSHDAECGKPMTEGQDPMLAAVEKGGGVGKCLNVYDISGGVNVSGGSSSCIFGVAVPALRPVHG